MKLRETSFQRLVLWLDRFFFGSREPQIRATVNWEPPQKPRVESERGSIRAWRKAA
jgi:hypothetical protein